MNFERTVLIARIDATIDRKQKAIKIRNADALVKFTKEKKEWMKTQMPRFVEFAHLIFEKEAKSLPITYEDCSEEIVDWNSKFNFFPRDEPVEQHPQVNSLLALKAALMASTDATVTTHGLKELGFRDINQLFSERN